MMISWYDEYQAKPFVMIDEESIKVIKDQFRKYGQVYNVMRFINFETLRRAYHSSIYVIDAEGCIYEREEIRSAGLDGITLKQYGENLCDNLDRLMDRLKQHRYRPKAMLRTHIPKEIRKEVIDGQEVMITTKERPLSIPSVEDSILQTAMVRQILEPIMEEVFVPESFAYRPNKGVKKALDFIDYMNKYCDANYVLAVDIKSYFDNINQSKLILMLEDVIKDKVFIGLIKEILRTPSKDIRSNEWIWPKKGVYQGMNISPILANLYLHNVMDRWYWDINTIGDKYMVRYADDIIFLCTNEEDIKIIKEEVKRRLEEYDLELSEGKTKEVNLLKEDLTFLGFRLVKDGRRIRRYIADKKINDLLNKIDDLMIKSVDDLKRKLNGEIKCRIKREIQYTTVYYIRKLNNLLEGIYRTYYGVKNASKLDDIYEHICNEIKNKWAFIYSEEMLVFLVDKIRKRRKVLKEEDR